MDKKNNNNRYTFLFKYLISNEQVDNILCRCWHTMINISKDLLFELDCQHLTCPKINILLELGINA